MKNIIVFIYAIFDGFFSTNDTNLLKRFQRRLAVTKR